MTEAVESETSATGTRDPYPVAARKLLRETLLDAALTELATREWDEVTMADIATGAGVSRQTLYKEFGSRNEFAQAFVLREGERFLADVEDAILGNRDDARRALHTAFGGFLEAADQHPMVRSALAGHGTDTILPLITTQGGPVIAYAAGRLTGIILTGWPETAREDVEVLSEGLVRLAISYIADRPGSPAETADQVTRLLAPFIERIIGDTPATA